jgi:hypothetical protein
MSTFFQVWVGSEKKKGNKTHTYFSCPEVSLLDISVAIKKTHKVSQTRILEESSKLYNIQMACLENFRL